MSSLSWAGDTGEPDLENSFEHSLKSSLKNSIEPFDEAQIVDKEVCVILLHGLGRSASSMWFVAKELKAANYFVVNRSYPSFQRRIDELAKEVISDSLMDCESAGYLKVSFVTHSMGGILVRSYLQSVTIPGLQRVVMLAPPNHGSDLIGKAIEWSPKNIDHLESFLQLSSAPDSYVNQLKEIHSELGIIAGSVSINPLFSYWLTGIDDSKVTIASACLPEMRQLLVYPVNHTMITFNSTIMDQVKSFLVNGRFYRIRKGVVVTDCDELNFTDFS